MNNNRIILIISLAFLLFLSSCSASLFQNERIDLSEESETDKTEEGLPAFQGGAESWTELMDLMRQYHKIILPLGSYSEIYRRTASAFNKNPKTMAVLPLT